jgi:hypothetical protein
MDEDVFSGCPDLFFFAQMFHCFCHERNAPMKYNQLLALTASVAMFAGCAQWREHHNGAVPISFNQMPPAAQATVRNEVGSQPIAAITTEYKYGEPTYRIEVERKGINPTLWVAADGSIIKESRSLFSYNQQMNEPSGAQNSTAKKPMQEPKQSSGSNY